MPETTDVASTETQSTASTEAQTSSENTTTQKPTTEPKEETFSKAYVDRMRKEMQAMKDKEKAREDELAASQRKKDEENGEFKKLLDQTQSEFEKYKKIHESERSAQRTKDFQRDVKMKAIQEGIIDADLVSMIDFSEAEYDDKGNPLNVDKIFAAFKSQKPNFFKDSSESSSETPRSTQTIPPRPRGDQGKPKLKDAKEMTAEEWQREWHKKGMNRQGTVMYTT